MVIRTLFVYRALAFIDAAVECDNTCAGYVRRVISIVAKQAKSDGELEARGASGVLIKVLLLVRGDTPEVLSLHARAQETKSPFPAFLSGRILTHKLTPGVPVQLCRGIIPQGDLPPAKSSRLACASPKSGEGLLAHPADEALYRHGCPLQALDRQPYEQVGPFP